MMKNLVRGSVVLSVLSVFVVFIYAQTQTETASDIANDSQTQLNIQNNFSVNNILEENKVSVDTAEVQDNKQVQEKKKEEVKPEAPQEFDLQETDKNKNIKKTGSTRATGGANRGSFSATAYCLRGRTASGSSVRRGIIAADPRVLPLGTRVNLAGGGQSGSYVVTDTGGKIKGKRIDIWMASCSDARRFGRRNVNISVLK